jgi:hypothetical protein
VNAGQSGFFHAATGFHRTVKKLLIRLATAYGDWLGDFGTDDKNEVSENAEADAPQRTMPNGSLSMAL